MTATLLEERTGSPAAEIASRRVRASNAAAEAFFRDHADAIARACQAMAARFQRGGRLLVLGDAPQRSDVAHVVVEFLHPVIVGKRALPAIAIDSADAVRLLGRGDDILLLLSAPGRADAEEGAVARERGMLLIRLGGAIPTGAGPAADFDFAVPSRDACIVQETHEMLYHVLWELVHVFLDHPGVRP